MLKAILNVYIYCINKHENSSTNKFVLNTLVLILFKKMHYNSMTHIWHLDIKLYCIKISLQKRVIFKHINKLSNSNQKNNLKI